MHISECVCPPHYVSVDDRSVGIERSRIFFSSRRAARPRHWKTTGSPELGNVEAVTYLVNLDNFPISQRAHCRVPSFVFSCRVSTAVCTRFCRNSLSLSLSFLFLISFFFCCWILLSFSLGQPLRRHLPLTHTSTLFGCCFIHNPAHFQRRSISSHQKTRLLRSVCSNNNLLDVFISSNLAALCTTNFLVDSPSPPLQLTAKGLVRL